MLNGLFFTKGLFEIFSSTSKKAGGILDHEKDVISFASRLKKPSAIMWPER